MANPHLTEGANHSKTGRYKEAIEAYNKIDKSDLFYPYALFNIGKCYFKQEKFIEAIGYYSQISNNHPLYQYAQYYLGECYSKQKKFIEAIEAYDKVSKNHHLFEKADSNISCIGKSFDLIEYIGKEENIY